MSDDGTQRYPVMLAVAGRLAVVVGSGLSAVRSIRSLVSHGADVVVISPEISDDLLAMEGEGALSVEPRPYASGDLEGAFIAIAASGSADTDAAVAAEARERGVLVNVSSDAEASDFIVPSVVRRGALQIAVTTGGGAPSVAREVRRCVAATFGPEWEAYTGLVAEVRVLAVDETGLTDADLAPLFASIEGSDLRARLAKGERVDAESLFEQHRGSVARDAEIAEG